MASLDHHLAMTRFLAMWMLLVLAVPATSWAQDPGAVGVPGVGSRIRVVTGDGRLTGVLAAVDANGVTVAVEGGPIVVPRASIRSMQMSSGRRGRAGEGALLGAVAGLLIGLASPTDEPGNCLGSTGCDRGPVVVGAMLGTTLMGAGIGAFIRTDRWVDARFDVGITAPAGPGAVGIVGRLRF
jgi:hypothetical protein